MFGRKKRTAPQQDRKPKAAQPAPRGSRVKASILSLESRLMFDAAAAATAAEINQEQVAQEQAESAMSVEGGSEPTAAETESQELLQAIASYSPGESTIEVVFVDPTVPNYQELLSGMDPNIEIIMLDSAQDGMEQMAAALSGRTGIDAIHIISHGAEGQLNLGTGTLSQESMTGQYADELATIQQALSEQADLLVYGCNFAEGEVGQEAVMLLSQLTGADVAASTDATGFAGLGGDWVLEAQIGTIETQIAVDDVIQANWVGLLAAPVVDLNAGASGNNVTTSFTEQTPVLIAPAGTLTDVDSANLNRLRVTLTARPDGNGVESLSLNATATMAASGAGLTVNYTASTGVLSITGTASTATYQTILRGILYNDTSDMPTTSNRSITVVARDSTNANSTSRTAIITVTAVNDAPTTTSLGGDSLAYNEGDGAVVIEQGDNALVADVDSSNFDTGTLTVSIPAGGDSAEDVLGIRNQGTGAGQIGVSGSNVTYQGTTIGIFTGGSSGSSLVITLNSNATPTAVTALVKNITYENTDTDAPTTGARTVRFALTDGDGGTSANYDTTVTVIGANDAPTDLSNGIELNTDGGNDAYLVSDTGLSQSLSATTVEIRFAANDLPFETVLMSFNNPTGDELSIQLDDPSNNLEIDFGAGTVAYASTIDYRAALVDGTVHTLSVTWDSTAGDWAVYIDGAFIESGTGLSAGSSLDTTNGQFVFGQEQDGQDSGYDSTQYFSGTIYDVRIWNDVRTSGEIAQYYQQQLDVTPAEAAAVGLVANWQMDGFNGSGQVVDIVSGNNLSIGHASGTGFTPSTVNSQLSIYENSANGSHVGFVTTQDPDAGETFSYSLTDSAGGRFAVNSVTGEITVANGLLLDYESSTTHNITVRVSDSGGLTYDEVLTIRVNDLFDVPVNTVPGAQTVGEDTPLAITGISVTDMDGNLSTVQLSVTNGTLNVVLAGSSTISSGANSSSTLTLSGSQADINATLASLVYQGNLNFNGADTLTVLSTDATANTDTDTVTVTVTAVNDPTVVTGGTSGTGTEDTVLTGTLTATDVEGLSDGTVFSVSTNATNGTASIDPATGLWSYTPTADWHGTDSFTVTITDDAGNTATQVISVTVTPVVDITADGLTTNEDTAISANVLTGTNGATADSFEGTPVLTGVTQGAHGSVTFLADGTVTYTPDANFHGTDSFTYTITSGGVTETATVTVTVTAVNDPTVVTGGTSGTGTEDTVLTGTLTATDVEGLSDSTVFSVSTNATNGTASIDPATGLWSYTPTADWHGTDSFTVTITDDAGNTATQVISVTVTPVNDAPVLSTNTGSTVAEGGTDTISSSELAVTDVDNSAAQLTYVIGSGPAYGRLELTTAPGVSATTFTQADIAANRLVYIHDGSETTSDNFTFTVSDGAGGSLGATTMTLTITPVNDAPTIVSNGGGATASINVAENVSAVTIVTGADVDLPAQTLTYSISGGVDQAQFTINAVTGALNFTAPPDFEVATDANGDNVYVVQVQVIDSQGASTIQTIQVTVTDVAEGLPPTPTTPPIPPVLLPTTSPPPTGPDPEPPSPPNSSEPPTDASLPSPGSQGPRSTPSDFQAVNTVSVSITPVVERLISLRDELRKLIDIGRDQAGFIPHDDTRRPVFTVLPVEPVPVLEPEPVEKQQSTSDLLLAKLSEMAGSLEQAIGVSDERHELVTRVAALTGTTLSAGFIVWALRSGALLASFMATMPAWRHFDPLPVLGGTRREWDRRRKDSERDQQAEATEFRGLKKLLG